MPLILHHSHLYTQTIIGLLLPLCFFFGEKSNTKIKSLFFWALMWNKFFCLYFILRSIRVDFLLLKWCTTFDLMLCNFSFSRRPAKFLSFLYFLIQLGWCWFINKVLNFIFLFFSPSFSPPQPDVQKKWKNSATLIFFYYRSWKGKIAFLIAETFTVEVNNKYIKPKSRKLIFIIIEFLLNVLCVSWMITGAELERGLIQKCNY